MIRFLWFRSQMKLQLSCFHTVWVPILYLVIFISKLELLQKPYFQQHRGRHLDGVLIYLFSQGLKLIWVKTAWLYLYWFKSYDRLTSTVNLLLHPPVYIITQNLFLIAFQNLFFVNKEPCAPPMGWPPQMPRKFYRYSYREWRG